MTLLPMCVPAAGAGMGHVAANGVPLPWQSHTGKNPVATL